MCGNARDGDQKKIVCLCDHSNETQRFVKVISHKIAFIAYMGRRARGRFKILF